MGKKIKGSLNEHTDIGHDKERRETIIKTSQLTRRVAAHFTKHLNQRLATVFTSSKIVKQRRQWI